MTEQTTIITVRTVTVEEVDIQYRYEYLQGEIPNTINISFNTSDGMNYNSTYNLETGKRDVYIYGVTGALPTTMYEAINTEIEAIKGTFN